MVKLLHTADVHLGRQFPALRSKGSEYRFQLLRTFEKITDLAASEPVSLLLIAGDLFDTNHIFGVTIGKVLAAFRKLESSGVRVCLLPGTHDAYTEDSIYRAVRFPPNVTVFTPEHREQAYEDLDLTVYGLISDGPQGSPLRGLKLVEETKFHVGMAHCSLRRADITGGEDILLDVSELAGSGLDYLALGHWHSFQDLSQGNTRACYSGSPEPVDRDQKGAGNVVMVKILEKNSLEITPVRIGTKKIDSLTIDVSPLESPESIVSLMEAKADPHLILEVTLTGLRGLGYDLSPEELENALGGRFFNLRVVDSSHPRLEEVKAQNFPEKTVTGRFFRIMEEKIARANTENEKSLYEEVVRLGFALLQGRGQVIEC